MPANLAAEQEAGVVLPLNPPSRACTRPPAPMMAELLPKQAFATVVDVERARPAGRRSAPCFLLGCRLLAWLMPKVTVRALVR